jgi:hypothetical protein
MINDIEGEGESCCPMEKLEFIISSWTLHHGCKILFHQCS